MSVVSWQRSGLVMKPRGGSARGSSARGAAVGILPLLVTVIMLASRGAAGGPAGQSTSKQPPLGHRIVRLLEAAQREER
jgi:hypothetical protein